MGDYILTVDDLRNCKRFEDVIAVGTYYLDGHKPDDDKRTYTPERVIEFLPRYTLASYRRTCTTMMAGSAFPPTSWRCPPAGNDHRSMTGGGNYAALAVKMNMDVRAFPMPRFRKDD